MSYNGEGERNPREDWGVSWHLDKRVNIGHLLTTLSLAVALFVYVQQQDRRLTILEERQASSSREIANNERNLTGVITDLKLSIERLNQRLERFSEARVRP
jgi:uncharacterized coiled-coil protein SlyX